jgi:tRNA-2-methylthio-N6-dimethylallyladenosine synthase
VIAQYSKIARHLHFPAQSGSTRILKRMNRRYTRGEYLKIISRFKVKIPQIKFSSDFIVGFPPESENDFKLTLSLVEKVEYESIFSFIYSPRKYTRSYLDKDKIALKIKKDRLYQLQSVQEEIQLKNNKKWVDKVVEVLVTQKNPRIQGEVIGRMESYRVVNFVSPARVGEFRQVLIKNAGPHSLIGIDMGDTMSRKGYLDFEKEL